MRRALIVILAALAATLPADAYVEAVYPLQNVLNESTVIVEGVVDSHDATKQIAAVKMGRVLKGKNPYPMVKITYGGGQFWHPQALPRHLVKGAPVLMFYNEARQSQMYLNRFFVQLYGDAGAPPEKAWWSMTHIEIRMNRTFNGPVKDLSELTGKILAGRAKSPAPSARIPAIDQANVKELPAHGEPLDEAKLPLAFRKFDPNAKQDASAKAVNAEGFVQRWLVLGPIPLGGAEADPNAALGKEWVPGQKGLKPAQHDKATVAGTEYRWEVGNSTDFVLDLGAAENSICVAVSYVTSEADVAEATLLTGSDDGAIWWLNGLEVQRVLAGRACEKDQDRSPKPVSLKKGVNVLMTGVINGGGPTGACARFVDKEGAPLLQLKTGAEAPK